MYYDPSAISDVLRVLQEELEPFIEVDPHNSQVTLDVLAQALGRLAAGHANLCEIKKQQTQEIETLKRALKETSDARDANLRSFERATICLNNVCLIVGLPQDSLYATIEHKVSELDGSVNAVEDYLVKLEEYSM